MAVCCASGRVRNVASTKGFSVPVRKREVGRAVAPAMRRVWHRCIFGQPVVVAMFDTDHDTPPVGPGKQVIQGVACPPVGPVIYSVPEQVLRVVHVQHRISPVGPVVVGRQVDPNTPGAGSVGASTRLRARFVLMAHRRTRSGHRASPLFQHTPRNSPSPAARFDWQWVARAHLLPRLPTSRA